MPGCTNARWQCFERAVTGLAGCGRAVVQPGVVAQVPRSIRRGGSRLRGVHCQATRATGARTPRSPSCGRQTPESNHVDRLTGLLEAGGLSPDDELHPAACTGQGTRRPRPRRRSLCAPAGRQGSASVPRSVTNSIATARLFEQVAATVRRRGRQAAEPGGGGCGPIFVVGMPRTGTTLVERILSSHSEVASAGESQNFGVLLKRATGTPSPRVLDEATLERSLHVDFEALGRRYLERTRPAARQAALRRQDAAEFLLPRCHRAGAAGGATRRRAAQSARHGARKFPAAVRHRVPLLRLRARPARHRAVLRGCSTDWSRTGAACCQGVSTK